MTGDPTRPAGLDRVLDAMTNTGGVHTLTWSRGSIELTLASCTDYATLCARLGAKPGTPRSLPHPTRRTWDALDGHGVVLRHLCWPHLDCWKPTPSRPLSATTTALTTG